MGAGFGGVGFGGVGGVFVGVHKDRAPLSYYECHHHVVHLGSSLWSLLVRKFKFPAKSQLTHGLNSDFPFRDL